VCHCAGVLAYSGAEHVDEDEMSKSQYGGILTPRAVISNQSFNHATGRDNFRLLPLPLPCVKYAASLHRFIKQNSSQVAYPMSRLVKMFLPMVKCSPLGAWAHSTSPVFV